MLNFEGKFWLRFNVSMGYVTGFVGFAEISVRLLVVSGKQQQKLKGRDSIIPSKKNPHRSNQNLFKNNSALFLLGRATEESGRFFFGGKKLRAVRKLKLWFFVKKFPTLNSGSSVVRDWTLGIPYVNNNLLCSMSITIPGIPWMPLRL